MNESFCITESRYTFEQIQLNSGFCVCRVCVKERGWVGFECGRLYIYIYIYIYVYTYDVCIMRRVQCHRVERYTCEQIKKRDSTQKMHTIFHECMYCVRVCVYAYLNEHITRYHFSKECTCY